jgi:twitching motility protein PilT
MPQYKEKLSKLIDQLIAQGASDLHIGAGVQPIFRVSGSLTPMLTEQPLTAQDMLGYIDVLLSPEHKKRFMENQEIDFSYSYENKARFRGNGYFERGNMSVALRLIPRAVRSIAELNLPPSLENFAAKEQGFFLVVGHGEKTWLLDA